MCRVQLGRGRCLVADKVLRYLHNNSMIKIGSVGEAEKTSSAIDERKGQKMLQKMNEKSSESLNVKQRTCLPFKIKLKTITFWRES